MNVKVKISPIDEPISADDASRLLGITPQWLHALERKGYITKLERGKYSPINVVSGYIKSISDDKPATAHAVSVAELSATKSRIAKLKEEMLSGKVVDYEETKVEMETLCAELFNDLSAAPAMFTRDISERKRLEQILGDIRNRFVKKLKRK